MQDIPHEKRFEILLYYISVLLLPSIFLFTNYNANFVDGFIIFQHVLILAGILAIAGLLAFIIFKSVSKSIEGAFLLSVFSWVCFWMFESILGLLAHVIPNIRRFVVILLIVMCIIVFTIVIRHFKPPFDKIKPVFIAQAIFIIFLFAYNLYPGVSNMISLSHNRIVAADENFHRQVFVIDEDLPSPDILWWHVDGMLNLETTERFWDVDMNYIRDELTQRGFIIYEDAFLNAGYTNSALAAYLSPEFYDRFWKEQLDKVHRELRDGRRELLSNALANAGLTYVSDVVPNFELFNAFDSRGYLVESAWGHERFRPRSDDAADAPDYFLGKWHYSVFMDLPELLALTTPLRIDYFLTYNRFQNDIDHLKTKDDALASFIFRVDKWKRPEDVLNTVNYYEGDIMDNTYPSVLEENITNLLKHIDIYIENNPDIVIVLQSDHGIRQQRMQDRLLESGYTLDEVLELNHSVFSAVRIPPVYGSLEAPIHPLNITRVLVNRFVGINYELLQ